MLPSMGMGPDVAACLGIKESLGLRESSKLKEDSEIKDIKCLIRGLFQYTRRIIIKIVTKQKAKM